jgi:hypothetical protein
MRARKREVHAPASIRRKPPTGATVNVGICGARRRPPNARRRSGTLAIARRTCLEVFARALGGRSRDSSHGSISPLFWPGTGMSGHRQLLL